MPAEEFTHVGNDVASRVRSQFGDASGAQLEDASILSWINDGQREIVNSNPILRATKITDIIAGTGDYTFPNDKVLLIEAIYVSGFPIQNVTPQEARDFILSSDPQKAAVAERPEVWYERAGIITFYPTPSKSATNGLKLEYIKNPTQLASLTDALGIPDRYFNELVNYTISKALEMDENYDAAAYKQRQFRDGLDRLANKDSSVEGAHYAQIAADPNDWF